MVVKIVIKIYKSNPRKFYNTVHIIIGKKGPQLKCDMMILNHCYLGMLRIFLFASVCRFYLQIRILPPNDLVSNIHILEISSVGKKLKRLDSRKSSYSNEIPMK